MILRPPVVRDRLRHLRRVLRNLEELRRVERGEFLSSYRYFWLAERGLQLAAEALFDVGTHVLAGAFNLHPAEYEDVTRRLVRQQVISEGLGERLRGLGGFRNILVHAYLEIDEGRVYDFLQNELEAFADFAAEIDEFLARAGEGGVE